MAKSGISKIKFMCGYVVIKSENKTPLSTLLNMRDSLRHRGNDDTGCVILSNENRLIDHNTDISPKEFNIGFGFQRLSIQDLSKYGNQPMISNNGDLLIVFNGEIYNFLELRRNLEADGVVFRSKSDTEVILNLYEIYGPSMLTKLNGMFSIVIFNRRNQEFFLARDRVGIKPLYFYKDNKNFFIASEIKAFLHHSEFKKNINIQNLDEFLFFRYCSGNKTLFKDVYQCLPGHYMIYKDNELTSQKYWDNSKDLDIKNPISEIQDILSSSVDYQLISDVEVGTQLSGGIDSSLITSISASRNKELLKTFSIIFPGSSLNEENYINLINSSLELNNFKSSFRSNFLIDDLEKTTWHFDQPLSQPNSIGIYHLSKLASQYLKVILSGEGADELFGGYDRFIPARIFTKYPYFSRLINSMRNYNFKRDGVSIEEIIISLSSVSKINQIKEIYPQFNFEKATEDRINQFNNINEKNLYTKFFKYEQSTYLTELLIRQDKMCMANGVENRVPFLDHRVIEFSNNLPLHFKTDLNLPFFINRNKITKKILKIISQKLFGNEFTYRKKQGFSVPLGESLKSKKSADYLLSLIDNVNELGLFSKKIYNLDTQNISSINRTWTIISLGAWINSFKLG